MNGSVIKRIAMLSVHTCPLATLGGKKTGGMNVYVRDLGREFGRRGIHVDVFTRSSNPDVPKITALGDNARVIHVVTGPEVVLDSSEIYPYLPEFVENVQAFVREDVAGGLAMGESPYDVIFSHYWLSGWVAHELRARWHVPVVQMFHTLGRMKNRITQRPTDQEADVRIFTETDVMSWADRLIAATQAEHSQMLWLYRADRRKIDIVSPGVDLTRFYPISRQEAHEWIGVPDEHRMLLFVGRIEPLKGVDNILRAFALMREESPELLDNVCMCVIGGDVEGDPPEPEMVRLLALRDELKLGERVTFLGARDQDILQYYYAAAEALIMPSDYESFGMVALEAMACGTPVIASEVGGLAFLVQDGVNGFHVPTREPAALAERICTILTDAEKRRQMSEAARQTAQLYGWPIIADRLLRVFGDVIAERAAIKRAVMQPAASRGGTHTRPVET
jgi:D-inositol-3-phosphate glycosyltransferase